MQCKREGCSKRVPALARKHKDPYCSTDCCRADHGQPTTKEMRPGPRRAQRPAVAEPEYRNCANPDCGHRFKVRKNRDTYCQYTCGRKHKATLQRAEKIARTAVSAGEALAA